MDDGKWFAQFGAPPAHTVETVAKEVQQIVVGAVMAGLGQGKEGSLQALERARAEIVVVLNDWLKGRTNPSHSI